MPKQKTIPELKAEIAANERQLAQLRHKQQQFENRAAYYEKNQPRVKRGVVHVNGHSPCSSRTCRTRKRSATCV